MKTIAPEEKLLEIVGDLDATGAQTNRIAEDTAKSSTNQPQAR
jgi:hypothetical protein